MKQIKLIPSILSACLLIVTGQVEAAAPLDPNTLTKFQDPLPVVTRQTGQNVSLTATEFRQQVLPSNFTAGPYRGKTTVWGYNGTYPGPTIEAVRGMSTSVNYINNLGKSTLYTPKSLTIPGVLPVDQTLHWADPLKQMGSPNTYSGPVPLVTHQHGAMLQSAGDGYPDAWYTPNLALMGANYLGTTFTYPNVQESSTLWYHDHTLGVTRLNVFAGLAGFYLLRDNNESALRLPGNSVTDNRAYEREIVIQDRSFDVNGQLVFPSAGLNPTVHPFWIPEYFGDVIVVNGKAWPYVDVEPRRYRFRLLNGSNARFYILKFSDNKTSFWQIGTDGGLLDAPVNLTELTLAPGERADVIVDFSNAAGSTFILQNSSKAPSPNGTAANPQTTGQVMQFRVGTTVTTTDYTFNPAVTPAPSLRPTNPIVRLNAVTPVKTRTLTLNEVSGPGGPLEVLLDGKKWSAPISETVKEGSTEIWQVVNLTADTHPIHIHLVPFQLLSRQPFQVKSYQSAYDQLNPVIPARTTTNPDPTPYLVSAPTSPDANEMGWKDTIRMRPGEVTKIAIRFAPTETPANVLNQTFPFNVSAGPGYVFHCHILDHEDNEMMRPLLVVK